MLDAVFLKTPEHSFDYRYVYQYAHLLKTSWDNQTKGRKHVLVLESEVKPELVISIASCWLLNIPFLIHPPAMAPLPEGLFKMELPRAVPLETKPEHLDTNHSRNDCFGYFFTSGTTGNPKTVPLKRRQMLSAADASSKNFRPRTNELWYLSLPLNHIGGAAVILRSVIYGNGIYLDTPFSAEKALNTFAANPEIHYASFVGTQLVKLVDAGILKTRQFKAVLLGGGPVPSDLVRTCWNAQLPVIPSYGMTETCAQIASVPLQSIPEQKQVSSGSVFHPNSISIRDDSGGELKYGLTGTIWLKGPQVFDGYLGETSESFEQGWFNTGDYGYLTQEGSLIIESRRTDRIVSGGENINPIEVEAALMQFPAFKEVAVTGIPHEVWGQQVAVAYVSDSHISQETIKGFLKGKIDSYKIPKTALRVTELPKTETGKLKRNEIARLFTHKH